MNPMPAVSRDELLEDPFYPRVKEFLIGSTGLAYYADKDADLARRVQRRLSSLDVPNCSHYLDILHDPVQGARELDALIPEVTIGETYFFRHREHFDGLCEVVLPELINQNAEHRRLRIWCAGCADGAEPYSLSILLRRQIAHQLAGWDVSILGTDINRQSLDAAEKGLFEEWSLRSTSEDVRQACFEKEGRRWRIAPEFRKCVEFRYHNLAGRTLPGPLGDPARFDLILCRNVMIYFGPDLMRNSIRQFYECLRPGAWLLVGPSEPNMTYFTSFRAVNAPGVTFFRKSAPEVASSDATARSLQGSALRSTNGPETLDADPVVREFVKSDGAARKPAPFGASAPSLADLRQLSDQGNWESAARCGEALLQQDGLNAMVHFQYALVREQMGNPEEAERSLRRAIYLDRRLVLAHYHLGLVLRTRRDTRQAMRSFENARTLLAALPGAATLAGADGITAAELTRLTQTQIELLGSQT